MELERLNKILDQYWAGESSLDDERILREYFSSSNVDPSHKQYQPLFAYFKSATETGLEKSPGEYVKTETKVISLASRLPAIAAAIMIVFAAIFGFQHLTEEMQSTQPSLTAEEIAEAAEAYEITKEALAYLSVNYKKGSDPLSVLPKSIESTRIFK